MSEPRLGQFSYLFETQAAAYSQFRPTYPEELFDAVFEYGSFLSKDIVALDLATGTGQTAADLAKRCSKVIAIDSNPAQLRKAMPNTKVIYQEGFAEQTGLSDNSVDLVTASQALHWFDMDRAFVEIARVLKPGASFAAWCYGLPEVLDNETASRLIWDLRFGESKLGPYWSKRNRLVDEGYSAVHPDPHLFGGITRRELFGHCMINVDNLVGFFKSWSAYFTFTQQNPGAMDLLPEFRRQLLDACGLGLGAEMLHIRWPIYLLLARNAPSQL